MCHMASEAERNVTKMGYLGGGGLLSTSEGRGKTVLLAVRERWVFGFAVKFSFKELLRY